MNAGLGRSIYVRGMLLEDEDLNKQGECVWIEVEAFLLSHSLRECSWREWEVRAIARCTTWTHNKHCTSLKHSAHPNFSWPQIRILMEFLWYILAMCCDDIKILGWIPESWNIYLILPLNLNGFTSDAGVKFEYFYHTPQSSLDFPVMATTWWTNIPGKKLYVHCVFA